MADIIQKRRDTAINWTSNNPILAEGEEGFETDSKKIKIGDGVTAWTDLPYRGGVESLVGGTDITVDLSDPSTPVISYSGSSGGGGSVGAMNDLSDVDSASPTEDSILMHVGSTWIDVESSIFAKVGEQNVFTAPQLSAITSASSGSYDLSLTNKFESSISADTTIVFTNINSQNGMGGTILFDNSSEYTISVDSMVVVDEDFLTAINVSGRYLIGFEVFGGYVYLTLSGRYDAIFV